MNPGAHEPEYEDRLVQLTLGLLSPEAARTVEEHAAACAECGKELGRLRAAVDSFGSWPGSVLRPAPLWERIAERIGVEAEEPAPSENAAALEWTVAGPGIEFVMLADDPVRHRVTMLVRLEPDAAYPPHRHAGVEELFLLDGELYIEERLLLPGDYNRAEAGSGDQRVWSETGCTCVLITSSRDMLGG